nr:hypothetical protein BgiMline_032416 [Biomphalaria glabrata]
MSYFVALVLLGCLAVSYAAVVQGEGPCPDGRVSGESWYEPNCGKCDCDNTGYTCYSCGVVAVNYDRATCYLQTNDSANYPDCCKPVLYCIGSAGFDPSKLQPPATTVSTNAPVTKPKITPKPAKKPTPKPTPKPTRKPALRATPKPASRPTPKPVPKPAQKPQVNRRG